MDIKLYHERELHSNSYHEKEIITHKHYQELHFFSSKFQVSDGGYGRNFLICFKLAKDCSDSVKITLKLAIFFILNFLIFYPSFFNSKMQTPACHMTDQSTCRETTNQLFRITSFFFHTQLVVSLQAHIAKLRNMHYQFVNDESFFSPKS